VSLTNLAAGFTSEKIVYNKAGERDLHLYIEKPSNWKATDRPIVLFFGGGWVSGKPIHKTCQQHQTKVGSRV